MNQLATPEQTSGQQQGREVSAQQQLRHQVQSMKPDWQKALPGHVTVEKFERVALTAVNQSPDLAKCDRRSLFAALTCAAQDGLLPDGREAALVSFGGKAQYMPMIGGILKKVRNSGDLATISAHVVYQNDEFDYELGDFERIKHKPSLDNRGRPLCAYAIAHLKDGSVMREVMSIDEIEQVRSVSRAANAGPWKQWWSEMARKTVLRRLSKRLPMSTDVEQAITRDDALYESDGSTASAVIDQQPQASEAPAVTDVSDGSDVQVAEVTTAEPEPEPEPAAAEPEPAQPQTEPAQPQTEGVPLLSADGEIVQTYKRSGDYLNALEKLIDGAQDADARTAIWRANGDTVERIYSERERARGRIDEIHGKVTGAGASGVAESQQTEQQSQPAGGAESTEPVNAEEGTAAPAEQADPPPTEATPDGDQEQGAAADAGEDLF